MFVATVITSTMLGAAITYAAVRKLSHRPEVVDSYARAGVPEERLNALAVVLLLAAFGLAAGLAWAPLGIAAAGGLIAYFAVATGFHVRNADLANVAMPIALAVLAIAVLVTRAASA